MQAGVNENELRKTDILEAGLTGEPMFVNAVITGPLLITMPCGVWLRTCMGVVTQSELLLIIKFRSWLSFWMSW